MSGYPRPSSRYQKRLHAQCFVGEDGKPFLQEAAIEIRVVGDDEDYPA